MRGLAGVSQPDEGSSTIAVLGIDCDEFATEDGHSPAGYARTQGTPRRRVRHRDRVMRVTECVERSRRDWGAPNGTMRSLKEAF